MPEVAVVQIAIQGPPGPPFGQPLNALQWVINPTLPPLATGMSYWDAANKTISTVLDLTAGVILQHGQEMHVRCLNKTGAPIPDGTAVYISGAQGNRPTIIKAQANSVLTSEIIGVTTQAIADNAEGFVTTFGTVNGVDTSGFTAGAELYLSATVAGQMTETAPSSPNHLVQIATVLNSTVNGAIFVHTEAPLELDDTFSLPTNLHPPSQLAVKTYLQNTYLPLVTSLSVFANNAAAIAGGLAVGKFYRTGGDPDHVCVVH